MKRQILSLALITALSASAFADSYADKYFEGSHNPKLNRHEQKGLGIAKNSLLTAGWPSRPFPAITAASPLPSALIRLSSVP